MAYEVLSNGFFQIMVAIGLLGLFNLDDTKVMSERRKIVIECVVLNPARLYVAFYIGFMITGVLGFIAGLIVLVILENFMTLKKEAD